MCKVQLSSRVRVRFSVCFVCGYAHVLPLSLYNIIRGIRRYVYNFIQESDVMCIILR